MLGRFSTTVYGQLKGDFVLDSTESFSDLQGNNLIQRPAGTPLAPPPAPQIHYAGEHPRTQFSIHDSRIGFRFRGPESESGVRVGGLLELDFFGTQPSTATEAATFDSSIPRVRHAFFRIETPVVDVLVGQTWHVFGWQNVYHPASVEAQGLPGEILLARDAAPHLEERRHVGGHVRSGRRSGAPAGARLGPPAR